MSSTSSYHHPLVVIFALSGGLLMAVPTLRALGARFGYAVPVVCAASKDHAQIIRSLGFANVHPVLVAAPVASGQDAWRFDIDPLLPLASRCDLLINLTLDEFDGPSFASLASRSGLPSVGFHAGADYVIGADPFVHAMDRFFEAAQLLCGTEPIVEFSQFPHRNDSALLAKTLRGIIGPGRLVALHADTKIPKMWPIDRWAQWLQLLWRDEPGTQVALLGYPGIPAALFAQDERLHDCRDLPLTACFELAAMADVFVGVDSCMLHAADFCRVPVVGLFTDTYPPEVYGARFADSESLRGSTPPHDITPADVWKSYCRLRDRQSATLRGSTA